MGWEQAFRRAGEIAAEGGELVDERHWDWRAVRGILAIAVYALAWQQQVPAAEVPLGALPWHLADENRVRALADQALACGEEAVAAEWAWLTRSWPETPGGVHRWDGLTRASGRDLDDPAIEICVPRAYNAVLGALNGERGPLDEGITVEVTGGEHDGRTGRIESSAWVIPDDTRTVVPGPPVGYAVVLDTGAGGQPSERVMITTGLLRPTGRATAARSPRAYSLQAPETPWETAVAWAGLQVRWHLATRPDDWAAGGTDHSDRSPLVSALIAAAILDGARHQGLDVGGDGSELRGVLMRPILDRLRPDSDQDARRLLAAPRPGAGAAGLADLVDLRALWEESPGAEQSMERDTLLRLARAVVTANIPLREVPLSEAAEVFDRDTSTVGDRLRTLIAWQIIHGR